MQTGDYNFLYQAGSTKKTLQRTLQRFSLSGKEGIRTPEALLTLTRFPGGPLQPLEHLSVI